MENLLLRVFYFISMLFAYYVLFLAIFCYRWRDLAGVATTIQIGAVSCALIATVITLKVYYDNKYPER